MRTAEERALRDASDRVIKNRIKDLEMVTADGVALFYFLYIILHFRFTIFYDDDIKIRMSVQSVYNLSMLILFTGATILHCAAAKGIVDVIT